MITLHHFKEAFQHYQTGRIPFRLLQDQAAVMIGICRNPHAGVLNSIEITLQDVQWLLEQDEAGLDYSDFLGGYVHVCETNADLQQIQGCDYAWAESHGGRWPNVMEFPMTWDSCAYLDEPSGEPQWSIFLLCWTDAGGPVYYVPRHLWMAARVEEHMQMTNMAWNP